jgi:hypothetical protein
MYAARPEPRLGNGETFAFLSKKICSGHTDVEIDLANALPANDDS